MLELSADNAADYLRRQGWVGAGPVRVEALSGGVSNAVLRVETPERLFVLKQSRPQLRTRDAWFSDLDRVYREQEVMQALAPLLPPGTVPEVLFSDRADVAAPERPHQIEIAAIRASLDRLEQQMADAEAEVHRRVAAVGRLVIDQREAVLVREDVLGAVVGVAQRLGLAQQALN